MTLLLPMAGLLVAAVLGIAARLTPVRTALWLLQHHGRSLAVYGRSPRWARHALWGGVLGVHNGKRVRPRPHPGPCPLTVSEPMKELMSA